MVNVIKDVKNINEKRLIIDGVLLVYRGRTRFGRSEVGGVIYNNKDLNDLRFRLKVFDFLRCGEVESVDMILEKRREILQDIFYDTKNIQVVKAQFVNTPSEMVTAIEKFATKDGAVIKDALSKYHQKDKWFKYKKRYELDVKVINRKEKEDDLPKRTRSASPL